MNQIPVVVDASVALKWVVPAEELARQAQALLADTLHAGQAIVGPPHLPGEVGNALFQRVRSQEPARHLTDEEAREALATFLTIPVQLLAPPELYERALTFALTHNLPSLYDSLYVVLAQILGAELWTADRRLLTALGSNTPWVRFIGEYPLT